MGQSQVKPLILKPLLMAHTECPGKADIYTPTMHHKETFYLRSGRSDTYVCERCGIRVMVFTPEGVIITGEEPHTPTEEEWQDLGRPEDKG